DEREHPEHDGGNAAQQQQPPVPGKRMHHGTRVKWRTSNMCHDVPPCGSSEICRPNFFDRLHNAFLQPPCALDICSRTWSTLKLEGFCRGGKSLNVSTNCCTSAWAGTTRKAR